METGMMPMLLQGLLNNFAMCFFAIHHPMLVGLIVLLVKRRKKVVQPCWAWNIAECISPLAFMLVLYYGAFSVFGWTWLSAELVTVLVLSISHTAYIPLHIHDRYTARNYFACVMDLICSLLTWSTIASVITVTEITRRAMIVHSRTFTSEVYFITFALLFGVLLLFKLIKLMILKIGRKPDTEDAASNI